MRVMQHGGCAHTCSHVCATTDGGGDTYTRIASHLSPLVHAHTHADRAHTRADTSRDSTCSHATPTRNGPTGTPTPTPAEVAHPASKLPAIKVRNSVFMPAIVRRSPSLHKLRALSPAIIFTKDSCLRLLHKR